MFGVANYHFYVQKGKWLFSRVLAFHFYSFVVFSLLMEISEVLSDYCWLRVIKYENSVSGQIPYNTMISFISLLCVVSLHHLLYISFIL